MHRTPSCGCGESLSLQRMSIPQCTHLVQKWSIYPNKEYPTRIHRSTWQARTSLALPHCAQPGTGRLFAADRGRRLVSVSRHPCASATGRVVQAMLEFSRVLKALTHPAVGVNRAGQPVSCALHPSLSFRPGGLLLLTQMHKAPSRIARSPRALQFGRPPPRPSPPRW